MEVEKLAAMSQVAAGIAHEINNPLASLVQSLTVLKRLVPRDHPQYSYTEKMKVCLDRITHITRQLYNLYRPPSPKADAVEVEWVIQSALDIMTPVASKKGVNLRSSLSVHKTKVDIAPGDLTQVLCNLIQNAVDASRPNLDVLVSTSLDQQIVTILVTDHGMGISAEILPRIFDPFFTTKYGYEGVGLGLGLALSKNLVESMGGTLQCSSQNGNGTTFRVSLPVTSDHG